MFLGHLVRRGRVVILDADDPSGYGYQLWLNRFLAAHHDTNRSLIDLRNITGGLTPEDLQALSTELSSSPPSLVVVDTFASAFLGLDTIKGHLVQNALTHLTKLAKDLHCTVITLDHVGKLRPGETVASRGPYGSAKTFSPRAVFALSRVPPKEVEGRDVIRLDCTKMSYAIEPPPKGIEIILEQDDSIARVKRAELPHETQLDAAIAAMRETLKSTNGEPLPRQALLREAVMRADITERYAETALKKLLKLEAENIEIVELPGRGQPKGYIWVGEVLGKSEKDDGEGDAFTEHPNSASAEDDVVTI